MELHDTLFNGRAYQWKVMQQFDMSTTSQVTLTVQTQNREINSPNISWMDNLFSVYKYWDFVLPFLLGLCFASISMNTRIYFKISRVFKRISEQYSNEFSRIKTFTTQLLGGQSNMNGSNSGSDETGSFVRDKKQ